MLIKTIILLWFGALLTFQYSSDDPSASYGEYQAEADAHSKKRKLDNAASAKETSESPLSNCPVVTPDESTHHAEHARVIIQDELDGNECLNRERQAILKSALEFVNSMARGTDLASDDDLALDESRLHGDCPDVPESIEPTPELLYMLLRGTDNTNSSRMGFHVSGCDTNENRVHRLNRNVAQYPLAGSYP